MKDLIQKSIKDRNSKAKFTQVEPEKLLQARLPEGDIKGWKWDQAGETFFGGEPYRTRDGGTSET